MSAFPGPTPPYNNPPIQPFNYQPRRFVISGVTLGQTTTVTTVQDMDYVVGQLVRLIIPPTFGCRQLNEQQAYVIDIPADNEVVLALDSSHNVDLFTSSSATTKPEILAIGDLNSGIISSTGRINTSTTIPGAFINIS
jgi:hypothetical protein